MKDIKNYMVTESKVDWHNVHDAILSLTYKYYSKPGVSQEVKDYCNKVREILDTIKL